MSRIGREEAASRAAGGVGLIYGVGFRVDRLTVEVHAEKGGAARQGCVSRSDGEATTLRRLEMVNDSGAGSFSAFDHQIGSIHNLTTCVIACRCPTMNVYCLKLTG
jgi:hypothetical protein